MIPIPPIWMAGAMGVVLAASGLAVGVTRYQLNSCRADAAELRAAHDILLGRVNTQNAAIDQMEKVSREAAENARKLRDAALKRAGVAEGKAKSLEASLRAPRPVSACVQAEAVKVVRANLTAQ
jgi:hypothetical protein